MRSVGAPFFIPDKDYRMLLVVTARTSNTYAQGHIADSGCTRFFCGETIPQAVMECGLNDARNPYVGKGVATCQECLSELNNGRRSGFRETTRSMGDPQ